MRVLLIEDDPSMVRAVESILAADKHQIESTDLGEEGVDLGRLYDFDAIILDINLPDMTGHDVLRKLRNAKVRTPVIILSGLNDTQNKVMGLGQGADDYIVKPFEKAELLARLQAVVRRAQGHTTSKIAVGPVSIDLDEKAVTVNDAPIHLTGKEYQMLELLALRKGATLSKETFLNHLYGGIDEPELKIVDVFICKLRKKIAAADPEGRHCIDTVWGRGYVMREPKAEIAA